MTEALKPSEVLERAAALIEPEGAWTRGTYSLDASGERVPPASREAACWCLYGAIDRVLAGKRADPHHHPDDYLYRALGAGPADFNDAPDRTQPEVVAALRKAAELARSEGQ